jgi:hypothetical protein
MDYRVDMLNMLYLLSLDNSSSRSRKLRDCIDGYMVKKNISLVIDSIFKMQDDYCLIYRREWMFMDKSVKDVIVGDIFNRYVVREVMVVPEDVVVGESIICYMTFGDKLRLLKKLYEYLRVGKFAFEDRMFYESLCRIYAMHLLSYSCEMFDSVYLYNVNDMKSIGLGHLVRLKQIGYRLVRYKNGNVYYQKYHRGYIPVVYFKFELYV